ncbi:MAG: Tryptophan synthase alpha chain [Betaproteobacteria bacterium]|jgi:tryptophan synthase alpha chain|nr:Tryptophan synthase alpha chain [Betaproteobacteria bacterium]MEA3153371.1 tryptophan synthase alpha chain [Betaproteobacteria bacterium]
MSRIAATFDRLRREQRKALIPFVTAGDPQPSAAVPLMHALVAGGADIIELGVPFSDPMADGPVIQRSSERALKHGVALSDVIAYIAEFRKTNTMTPVILFGYANPIESMGVERFADSAKRAGADGVLVVDYPPEEAETIVSLLDARELDTIFLLSPTTTGARLKQIAALGRGYLYYVSLKGVTGAAHIDLEDVARRLAQIRKHTDLPVGVGFGIRDPQTARRVATVADAVVIGSRLVQEIESSKPEELNARVTAFLTSVRTAMDENKEAQTA